MAESRSIEQITLDTLGREKARLEKKLATSKQKTESPLEAFLEARTRAINVATTKPIDHAALEAATAELKHQEKRMNQFQNQDNIKLYDEQTTLRIEIMAIDEEVAMIKYRRRMRA